MGVIVNKTDQNSELDRRIAADLREKMEEAGKREAEIDFTDKEELKMTTEKTHHFAWLWLLLLLLAAAAIIAIVFSSSPPHPQMTTPTPASVL